MRFLGLMLLGALGLGGCGKKPVLDAEDLARAAAGYIAAHNDLAGDEAAFTALFRKPAKAAKQRAQMAWMHAQVGDCGEMRPIWRDGQSRGRFGFTCERGGLELSLRLDRRGQIADVISGVSGVEPTAAVARATQEVVAAMPWHEAAAGQHAWGDALMPRWARKRGRCEVERVRVVREHVGMFDLRCEHGGMILKVGVRKDGKVGEVKVWRPEQDEARAIQEQPAG